MNEAIGKVIVTGTLFNILYLGDMKVGFADKCPLFSSISSISPLHLLEIPFT